ncbi:MAG: T9SS type A sorting domain-containing protein [Saprospiraceae bacterium]|nr:T9SS type A sorting domain-containing protein [Saprospiraceae bacterium]
MSSAAKKWLVVLGISSLSLMGLNAFGQCPDPNPILGASHVCPGSISDCILTFDNSAENQYTWELSGGGEIMGPTNKASITIAWQATNDGPFTIKCTERSGQCYRENFMTVHVADDLIRYPFNCFSEINIPFDENCQKLIEPGHLLTNGAPDCPLAFRVELSIDGEIPISNPVTIEYIDQVITAQVIHIETGRACISLVTLKDGTNPVITCENDTTICNNALAWDPFDESFKEPTAVDNCDQDVMVEPLGYEWIDLFEDPLFAAFIIRNWSAVDKYGNTSYCSDTIFVRDVIFDQIVCPPDTTILCDDPFFDISDPLTSGVPTFLGLPLVSTKSFCELTVEYSDRISPNCPGNYSIHRRWTLTEFTNAGLLEMECLQKIHIIDTTGPSIEFDSDLISVEQHDDLFGVNPDSFYKTIYYPTLDFGCVAHGYIPTPIIIDNCSSPDSVEVDIEWSLGHLNYFTHEIPHLLFENLPRGKHVFRLKARDGCHNLGIDTLVVITEDRKAPYMAIDKEPVVTLGSFAEITWIDVSVFDEGTWDNCELYTILGRRIDWDSACGYTKDSTLESTVRDHYDNFWDWLQNDPDGLCRDSITYGWTNQIPFCCEDACSGEPVILELLAIDANCNMAKLWVNVLVEDKSAPEIQLKLPDLNISCYAYNHYYRESIENGDFTVFGNYTSPTVSYGQEEIPTTIIKDRICTVSPDEFGEYYQWVEDTIPNGLVFDNCGADFFETQKVHFEKCGEGWIERKFVFKGNCNSGKADSTKAIQRINIYNDCPLHETEIIWPAKDIMVYGCGFFEVETDEPRMKYPDDCREIGIHHKDQVIERLYGLDSTCVKIIRTWAVIDWCRQTKDPHDEWIGDQGFHYFEFEQIIYIINQERPEISGCNLDTLCIGSSCKHDLHTTVAVSDDCTPSNEIVVSWTLFEKTDIGYFLLEEGDSNTAIVDDLKIGTYKLVWKAVDGCSNETYCTDFFTVVDCVKPTPICVSSTTLRLLPLDVDQNGSIDTAVGEIWAIELDVSSHDNCQAELTDFRIRWRGTGVTDENGILLPPDSTDNKLTLGCIDVGQRTAEMWVVDRWGNADFCEVLIIIQGPEEGCSGELGKVNGNVSNIIGAGVPEVILSLEQDGTLIREAVSDKIGNYSFGDYLMDEQPHRLTPSKEDDPVVGISTIDIIKISKHLLSKEEFSSSLYFKAADANGDGNVSVLDIITLRKLLLGKIDNLPTEKLWYFFNFKNESSSLLTLGSSYRDYLGFTGIKIGDLNGDAVSGRSPGRSAKDLYVLTNADQEFVETDRLVIPIIASEDIRLQGFQMEVGFDKEKIDGLEIESKRLTITEEAYSVSDSKVLCSWYADEAYDIRSGDTLFTLIAQAITSGQLSESLAMQDRYLTSELYLASDSIRSIRWDWSERKDLERMLVVGQNFPNPFVYESNFEVSVPQSGMVDFIIYNTHGQLLKNETKYLEKGMYRYSISKDDLGPIGIYFYRISTSYDQQTRKVILTE